MPREVAALQAEIAALRVEMQTMRDAPTISARRRAPAEVWLADLAWRTSEARLSR